MSKNREVMSISPQVVHEILAGLHYLSQDESEAMKGYEEFEAKYGMYLKKSELKSIRDFIAEEKKHLKKLMKMIKKRDGIAPEGEHNNAHPMPVAEVPRKEKKIKRTDE